MCFLKVMARSVLSAALLSAAVASSQAQSNFPNRPIVMVVPLQAGTASDLVARIIAQDFSERTGKTMLIENVLGGGGGIGAARVARSAPDGYTIGAFNSGIHTILPFTGMKLGFEPFEDLIPVTVMARFPSVLIARSALSNVASARLST